MNGVDAVLGFLVVGSALRGYWRGFFRECFGVLGFVGGLAAALQFSAAGEAVLQDYLRLPPPLLAGAAFVMIFVTIHIILTLVGVLLNHAAGPSLLRGIGRFAAVLLGGTKGAAVLAFVLLFFHLFPAVPALDARIMTSKIGRPLVFAAGEVIRVGSQPTSPRQS